MDTKEPSMQTILEEQFKALPPVVKNAITGADVENRLRKLSDKHKLHLDQWQMLENEVMMTLIGLESAENVRERIQKEVGIDADIAQNLANDIALEVFDPIRKEMERQLAHPDAKPKETEPIEDLRSEILAKANTSSPISSGEKDVPAVNTPASTTSESEVSTPTPKAFESSVQSEASPQTEEKISSDTEASQTPTPEMAPIEEKPAIKRAPISGAYVAGGTSSDRADIKDDPYRESVDE